MDSSDYTFSFFPDYIRARYAIGLIFKVAIHFLIQDNRNVNIIAASEWNIIDR